MVNLAIQVLPLHCDSENAAHDIIDEAIAIIQNSELRYVVCPFETVVEGEFAAVMQLLEKVKDACLQKEGSSVIINMKLHANAANNISIHDKMKNYS